MLVEYPLRCERISIRKNKVWKELQQSLKTQVETIKREWEKFIRGNV